MFTSRITNGLRFAIKNRQSFLHTSTPIKSKEIPNPNNTIDPIKSIFNRRGMYGLALIYTCASMIVLSASVTNQKSVQEIIQELEEKEDEEKNKKANYRNSVRY